MSDRLFQSDQFLLELRLTWSKLYSVLALLTYRGAGITEPSAVAPDLRVYFRLTSSVRPDPDLRRCSYDFFLPK